MIPLNYLFAPKEGYSAFQRQAQQGASLTAENLTDIKYLGIYNKFIFDTSQRMISVSLKVASLDETKWGKGMQVLVAGCNQMNGNFEITSINYVTSEIIIDVPYREYDWTAAVTGTITPKGVVDNKETLEDATILYNNKNDIMGYQYSSDSVFFIEINGSPGLATHIQVINTGTGNLATTFYLSIDGVNFSIIEDLGTTIDPGNNHIYKINELVIHAYLKLVVDVTGTSFYVIGK